jgi:ribonuclease HII
MVKVRAMRTVENALRRFGFHRIAGVDEVGRGCLAGPVVAAAVILDPDKYIPHICDSKTTTALQRERLYSLITKKAVAWSVASAQPARRAEHSSRVARSDAARRHGHRAAA